MSKEIDVRLVAAVAAGMQQHIGSANAITGPKIMAALRARGYKASGAQLREAVHHLRVKRRMFICADHRGYYLASTKEEKEQQIRSMKSRVREIQEVVNALNAALNETQQQQTLFNG